MTEWTQNRETPEDLLSFYAKTGVLDDVRHFYETWRKTTALIDPPAEWDLLDSRTRVAMCAVANVYGAMKLETM